MKIQTHILLFLLTVLLFTSCRQEESELIEAPEEETLMANSNIALLMQRTAYNDGSFDNIIDRANCFSIAFPYTINVNSQEITLYSENDYDTVECVFEQSNSNSLTIIFPVTIILVDFSEIVINNLAELNNYANSCNDENVEDDDIECLDFHFPIEASIFNVNNELLETVIIENDFQLYSFISNINISDIVTITFPIMVTLADGSEISIANFTDLETTIINAINTCDEDDDYDFNDDDCDGCTSAQIIDLLTSCTDWEVDKLERNATDYDDAYDGYRFNFFTDNTMSASWNTTTVYGTYETSGNGNNLEILINMPSLPLCNNSWIVHEIETCSDETKIDLRVGNDDRLRYENNCN